MYSSKDLAVQLRYTSLEMGFEVLSPANFPWKNSDAFLIILIFGEYSVTMASLFLEAAYNF